MKKEATISKCSKYRYQLLRKWDDNLPMVLFIMCNPSTADGTEDDPTIRRCIGFAKSWGYGGIYVGNLFAYRATNPKELLTVDDPIGEENQIHLNFMASNSKDVIAAWGNGAIVERLFKNIVYLPLKGMSPLYIDLCKDGTPKHPLYLKEDLKPKQCKIQLKKAMF